MPPDPDIYGLTKHCDVATINRFLDAYVDRAASENREDEELMMEPLPTQSGTDCAAVEWEPALTLSHIIERGLAFPRLIKVLAKQERRIVTCNCSKKGIEISSRKVSIYSSKEREDQAVCGISVACTIVAGLWSFYDASCSGKIIQMI
jgi:hypothetical protein